MRVQYLGWEDAWRRKWLSPPVFLPEKSQGRGAWQATVHGVTKSCARLMMHTQTHTDTQPSPEDEKLQLISQHGSRLDGRSATSHPNPYLYPRLPPNTDFQTLT